MPEPLIWTEPRDTMLCSQRALGRSWDAISAQLGISRWAAIERGRVLGATKPARTPTAPAGSEAWREALPPGHPISWGAITAGTLLAGEAYPFPPLDECEGALGLAA